MPIIKRNGIAYGAGGPGEAGNSAETIELQINELESYEFDFQNNIYKILYEPKYNSRFSYHQKVMDNPHGFWLIITGKSSSSFKAHAERIEDDDYYKNNDLKSWQIEFNIITYNNEPMLNIISLEDEFHNKASFDFKNIVSERYIAQGVVSYNYTSYMGNNTRFSNGSNYCTMLLGPSFYEDRVSGSNPYIYNNNFSNNDAIQLVVQAIPYNSEEVEPMYCHTFASRDYSNGTFMDGSLNGDNYKNMVIECGYSDIPDITMIEGGTNTTIKFDSEIPVISATARVNDSKLYLKNNDCFIVGPLDNCVMENVYLAGYFNIFNNLFNTNAKDTELENTYIYNTRNLELSEEVCDSVLINLTDVTIKGNSNGLDYSSLYNIENTEINLISDYEESIFLSNVYDSIITLNKCEYGLYVNQFGPKVRSYNSSTFEKGILTIDNSNYGIEEPITLKFFEGEIVLDNISSSLQAEYMITKAKNIFGTKTGYSYNLDNTTLINCNLDDIKNTNYQNKVIDGTNVYDGLNLDIYYKKEIPEYEILEYYYGQYRDTGIKTKISKKEPSANEDCEMYIVMNADNTAIAKLYKKEPNGVLTLNPSLISNITVTQGTPVSPQSYKTYLMVNAPSSSQFIAKDVKNDKLVNINQEIPHLYMHTFQLGGRLASFNNAEFTMQLSVYTPFEEQFSDAKFKEYYLDHSLTGSLEFYNRSENTYWYGSGLRVRKDYVDIYIVTNAEGYTDVDSNTSFTFDDYEVKQIY